MSKRFYQCFDDGFTPAEAVEKYKAVKAGEREP